MLNSIDVPNSTNFCHEQISLWPTRLCCDAKIIWPAKQHRQHNHCFDRLFRASESIISQELYMCKTECRPVWPPSKRYAVWTIHEKGKKFVANVVLTRASICDGPNHLDGSAGIPPVLNIRICKWSERHGYYLLTQRDKLNETGKAWKRKIMNFSITEQA